MSGLLSALFGPAPTPPFTLEAPSRFPQSTYVGRCRHFFQVINPTNLLITDGELASAQATLAHFKSHGRVAGVSDEQLWSAKLVRDSTVHPDTGEKIPLPFRMSAFAVRSNGDNAIAALSFVALCRRSFLSISPKMTQ